MNLRYFTTLQNHKYATLGETGNRRLPHAQGEGEEEARRPGRGHLQLRPEAVHPHVMGERGSKVAAR